MSLIDRIERAGEEALCRAHGLHETYQTLQRRFDTDGTTLLILEQQILLVLLFHNICSMVAGAMVQGSPQLRRALLGYTVTVITTLRQPEAVLWAEYHRLTRAGRLDRVEPVLRLLAVLQAAYRLAAGLSADLFLDLKPIPELNPAQLEWLLELWALLLPDDANDQR